MDQTFLPAGVELLIQDYLAARRELHSRTDLAPTQREILMEELVDEHRLRSASEWEIVLAQLHDDQDLLRLLRTPNLQTSWNSVGAK